MYDKVSFGKKVRLARKIADLTQEELSGKLGYGRTWITEVEQGRIEIGPQNIYDIARATGKRVSWFFDEGGEITNGTIAEKLIEKFDMVEQTCNKIRDISPLEINEIMTEIRDGFSEITRRLDELKNKI